MSEPRVTDPEMAHAEAIAIEQRDTLAQRLMSLFQGYPVARRDVWAGMFRVADALIHERDEAERAVLALERTLVEANHELYAVANALHRREGYTATESEMRRVETSAANTLTEVAPLVARIRERVKP